MQQVCIWHYDKKRLEKKLILNKNICLNYMPGQFGNKGGGRKTMEEEALNIIKKRNAAELAKDKVTNHLKMMKSKDRQGVKDIALPVYLKHQVDKHEVIIPKPLLGGDSIKDGQENTSNKQTTGIEEED
jgi:hypothetical protein